jgi:hypothetical protein
MRARNIKPGFFKNEDLAEIGSVGQVLFAGTWGMADREGKLEDRVKRIKAEIFPYYEPHPGVDELLNSLCEKGLIIRYSVDGKNYIKILNFLKHQRPHTNEAKSVIPEPLLTMEERTFVHGEKSFQPNGEALRPDSLNPDSLNPEDPPTPPGEGNEKKVKDPKGRRGEKAGKPLRITPEELVALWNEIFPLPGTKEVTLVKERRRKAEVRLKENSDLDWWRTVFQKIKITPFLRGETGSFKAAFDWCIKNGTNAMKVYEGQYDERTKDSRGTGTDPGYSPRGYDQRPDSHTVEIND